MEIDVFDTCGFQVGDFVRVTMNDGYQEVIQLEKGNIYMGVPERRNYATGEIIPATLPSIVVQGNLERPEGRGIPIVDVFDVALVNRP